MGIALGLVWNRRIESPNHKCASVDGGGGPGFSARHRTGQVGEMAKEQRKHIPRTVLKLADLAQSKAAVLNTLTSLSSGRSYDHAIREFIEW